MDKAQVIKYHQLLCMPKATVWYMPYTKAKEAHAAHISKNVKW